MTRAEVAAPAATKDGTTQTLVATTAADKPPPRATETATEGAATPEATGHGRRTVVAAPWSVLGPTPRHGDMEIVRATVAAGGGGG